MKSADPLDPMLLSAAARGLVLWYTPPTGDRRARLVSAPAPEVRS
jgi:hypothetical protein